MTGDAESVSGTPRECPEDDCGLKFRNKTEVRAHLEWDHNRATTDARSMLGMDSSPSDDVNQLSAKMEIDYWRKKATENVDEWGLQDIETLLLAMQEEQGELAQAYLEAEHEEGELARVSDELDDLAALCIQLRWRLESL